MHFPHIKLVFNHFVEVTRKRCLMLTPDLIVCARKAVVQWRRFARKRIMARKGGKTVENVV